MRYLSYCYSRISTRFCALKRYKSCPKSIIPPFLLVSVGLTLSSSQLSCFSRPSEPENIPQRNGHRFLHLRMQAQYYKQLVHVTYILALYSLSREKDSSSDDFRTFGRSISNRHKSWEIAVTTLLLQLISKQNAADHNFRQLDLWITEKLFSVNIFDFLLHSSDKQQRKKRFFPIASRNSSFSKFVNVQFPTESIYFTN